MLHMYTLQLIWNLKIEFLYYIDGFSSTHNTLLCDYVQSALIRLEIPVACLVRLGMICVSPLSHWYMSVYYNIMFDRMYIYIVNTV